MKYIVYKTTNLINNYIYIGVHKTNNPEIFDGYLGNGINIKIPYSYKYSKTKFQQAVGEFGIKNFKRETLGIYDTFEEASEVEKLLVNENFLKREDVYNMLLGGYSEKPYMVNYRFNHKGEFIQKYNSYEEAALDLGVSASSIRRAVIYNYKIKNTYFTNIFVDKLDLTNYTNNIKKVSIKNRWNQGTM